MKKLIVMGAVFAVGFAAGGVVLQRDSLPAAAQGAPTECAKLVRDSRGTLVSDVNGDGGFDISDAVYILNFLFTGGAAPKPICGGVLPATGQTGCSDDNGKEITCEHAGWPGQDGFYRTGCPNDESRFVDNGDGTVTDTCTGLMWQKETGDTNGDADITAGDAVDWRSALNYCEDLTLADHEDWRLPNVHELQSILNFQGRAVEGGYLIYDERVFPYDPDVHWLWTSTTLPWCGFWAYVVGFQAFLACGDGQSCAPLAYASKTPAGYFVRAVRGP